jgi:sec-independent protein translocase protein TatB
MFGIGTTELLIVLVVALIVLGPKKLPEIARTLGKGLAEFKRVSNDVHRTINLEVEREDMSQRKKEAEKELFGDKGEDKKKAADTAAEGTPDAGQAAPGETGAEPATDLAGEAVDVTPEPAETSSSDDEAAGSKKDKA